MKKIIGIVLVIILIFALGCVETNPQDGPENNNDFNNDSNGGNGFNNLDQFRKVKAGDNISVNYTGKLASGEVFDSSLNPGRTPLKFVAASGQMIKGFDNAVIGMIVGEKKSVIIPPEQAYGSVQYVDINQFEDTNIVEVGMVFHIPNSEVKVFSVDGNTIGLTNNHDLAGYELFFEIEIVSIE